MHIREHVVAQDAGNGEKENDEEIDDYRFLAAPAKVVDTAGNNIFKNRNNRGEAGEGHEDKEQAAPQLTHRHVRKNLGQRDEDEGRALVRVHVIGKAGGENDEPCHDGHEGIENADAHRFAGQGEIIGHVAAEDFNGRDAQRQGEECLVHGRCGHISNARFHSAIPVGKEIKFQPRAAAFQHHAMAGENHNQAQEAKHHPLRDALEASLHAEAADQKAYRHGDGHKDPHFHGISQHGAKDRAHLRSAAGESAIQKFPEIRQHPAGHGGVVHHEQVAAQDAEPAVNVPQCSRLLQGLVRRHGALLTPAAHGKLHGHHRDAHEHQEYQIKEYKDSAAVFAGDIGELPHIPDADGTAGTDQKKSQSGFEIISFFHSIAS